ncbi:Peptidoglycan/LPS O-acetylase OafA/YrhL, contains acyltransferase and SGNH-hydrolase domains [Lutibacter agarilyticus]|uniref:Peptidoglycan/LPS O-acetylase OafA/YrhL, contains acyltransferase and SGNH-hydrolase domains n=1 Tax=Lutibacter agarilyticus TaxID=1109740 RepID=A0A238VFC0_9FLAO|nr:acyltransferase [Lutibacter agarilyticus]SNR32956.1 Peptidoglycan/LPS O-acetylase OafA/YrhL, contains acyltransferase and SGNH-hydrolase domains [Lutibacter agarilyticus]
MVSTKFNRIFGLDFLRALAISLVLVSHLTFLIFPNEVNLFITAVRILGAIGVDLFFVLSGYLIGGILLKQLKLNKTSSKDLIIFWKRRWLRTLPNYFLVLFLNVFIFIILGKQLPENWALYIPFLQNFIAPHPNFFTEAWSLSIEEYAYLVVPSLLFYSFKLFNKGNKQKLFLYTTLIVVVLLTFIKINYYLNTTIVSYHSWSISFRKVVIYRVDSIYIGFLLAYAISVYKQFFNSYKKHLLFFGILGFFGIHLIIFSYQLTPEINPFFYVFVYIQAVLISIALVFPYFITLNYTGVCFKPIQFLSIHSYAIYLVNYSIVLLILQEFFNFEDMSLSQKGGMALLFLTITLLISKLIYHFFELPILKYRDRVFSRN